MGLCEENVIKRKVRYALPGDILRTERTVLSKQKTGNEVHRLKNRFYRKYHMRIAAFLIAACMMASLSGCGQEETVSVDAQVQAAETSDMTESDSAAPATTEDAEEDTAEEDSAASGTAEDAAQQDSTESTQQDTVDNQLKIDDETRQQLMTELLEENGMDTSVVEPGRSTRVCTFEVPEGFEESQDVDNLYVTARYPLDTSMIYYEVMDGDISLQLMTEEMFKEQAKENISQIYGEDVEVNIDSYESVKIDGYPTFRILCHYEAEGIKISQLEYVINADRTYVVTYSQTSDYDWMEAFETSAATIHVK